MVRLNCRYCGLTKYTKPSINRHEDNCEHKPSVKAGTTSVKNNAKKRNVEITTPPKPQGANPVIERSYNTNEFGIKNELKFDGSLNIALQALWMFPSIQMHLRSFSQ